MGITRIFVEKKQHNDIEAQSLLRDLKDNLGIQNLAGLRILNRYDIDGIDEAAMKMAELTILSEPPVDHIYHESAPVDEDDIVFGVRYLPGQYDQRADSLAQCFQIMTKGKLPEVLVSKIFILKGNLSVYDVDKIKSYTINPVDSMEIGMEKPDTLAQHFDLPDQIEILSGFTNQSDVDIGCLCEKSGFAMSKEDLIFCRDYFRDEEKRDPTITEIKAIDTYWSDHCRHTTFLTELETIEIDNGYYQPVIQDALNLYLDERQALYQNKEKPICLMDLAVIGMKALKNKGYLNDLDESEEINACSIEIDVNVDEKIERWLLQFKNETHNHPTEIEPFGGAATCLGGAIRDPLSGRAYVYQAMRVTGAGNPNTPINDTIPGKLPQRKITTGAAHGYSSYGNQIGLATGHVREIYDDGFVAKRMEIGAVIGAVPKAHVRRETPEKGDLIILVGGRTGRDGCGGATGSSKEHTEESLAQCGAEVQKGNPPTERKLQRLFRSKETARLIKRCNDFGAGGVSVAIGELADSLQINLDAVPKKYEGLDGTELAISESQERMAVVVEKEDAAKFMDLAAQENLEATIVGEVTDTGRLQMYWKDQKIVDIKREFLNTNGAPQKAHAKIASPIVTNFQYNLSVSDDIIKKDIKKAFIENLKDLNVCSQKGLVERFDSTIGAGTVLMPFGGQSQLTPEDAAVAKIPVLSGETATVSMMTYGYQPHVFKWSPFHGGVYAVVEALAKLTAAGGDFKKARLTCQEYFERMTEDPYKWGKPAAALLGALFAQMAFKTPSIGGKDSMSGTFKDLHVPPVLTAFAVCTGDSGHVVSGSFKAPHHPVYLLKPVYDDFSIPDTEGLCTAYRLLHNMIKQGLVQAAMAVKNGGVAEVLCKMAFGNGLGITIEPGIDKELLFNPLYGGIIFEASEAIQMPGCGFELVQIGITCSQPAIIIEQEQLSLQELINAWNEPLESVFQSKHNTIAPVDETPLYQSVAVKNSRVAKPKVFMPVFPGTNCEYDTMRAFEKAGGEVNVFVFKNLNNQQIDESIKEMVDQINNSQIISLVGGFSAGDEPDGSGKFIAAVFRNPYIKEAAEKLLSQRDGLMLGICNGFQALVKLGLLPYGKIQDLDASSPTLTYNTIGRHISTMCKTKVISNKSPFLWNVAAGDIFNTPISHGEGRFSVSREMYDDLATNGQIATLYVDSSGKPAAMCPDNPNGSDFAIEGITSLDGRVFGKMGHSERIGEDLYQNIPGTYDQKIFQAGIGYYK